MKPTKIMDHTNYPKRLRTLPIESLNFISKDARAAVEANPEGENVSYYLDEICYVVNEKIRRNKRGLKY